jgi:hypothetical protein
MTALTRTISISIADYLAEEELGDVKHEYLGGTPCRKSKPASPWPSYMNGWLSRDINPPAAGEDARAIRRRSHHPNGTVTAPARTA